MIDWITIAIELVGIAIMLMWIVIPIREFREIFRAVKHKSHPAPDDDSKDLHRDDGPRA